VVATFSFPTSLF